MLLWVVGWGVHYRWCVGGAWRGGVACFARGACTPTYPSPAFLKKILYLEFLVSRRLTMGVLVAGGERPPVFVVPWVIWCLGHARL